MQAYAPRRYAALAGMISTGRRKYSTCEPRIVRQEAGATSPSRRLSYVSYVVIVARGRSARPTGVYAGAICVKRLDLPHGHPTCCATPLQAIMQRCTRISPCSSSPWGTVIASYSSRATSTCGDSQGMMPSFFGRACFYASTFDLSVTCSCGLCAIDLSFPCLYLRSPCGRERGGGTAGAR